MVITDRAMPNMNGVELATSIKRMSPDTPIVMLSGFGAFLDDQNDLPKGVDCVAPKPATIEALRAGTASLTPVLQNQVPTPIGT